MSIGLQYALSARLSSDGPRVSAVVCENGPSLFTRVYIQEALNNCLEMNEGRKPYIHLVLVSNDVKEFILPELRMQDVSLYNHVREPCFTLESLYESVTKNIKVKQDRNHVLIIDDYSVFSTLSCARDVGLLSEFLRLISKRLKKMFLFFCKETLSAEETAVVYNLASDLAYLQLLPESIGSICNNTKRFSCDLLKIRHDRRVSHERTSFQVLSDGIKEEFLVRDLHEKDGSGSSDVLKNLTTFKLTLEDDEKASRSKLHLPYFEAQKTSLEDPGNFDDYDDDEEDEEV